MNNLPRIGAATVSITSGGNGRARSQAYAIHVARSDVELFKIAQYPPLPTAECKGDGEPSVMPCTLR